jgi:uncharacterized membrane protein YoaT (DUF817 family)
MTHAKRWPLKTLIKQLMNRIYMNICESGHICDLRNYLRSNQITIYQVAIQLEIIVDVNVSI